MIKREFLKSQATIGFSKRLGVPSPGTLLSTRPRFPESAPSTDKTNNYLTLRDGTNLWYNYFGDHKNLTPFVYIHGNGLNHKTAQLTQTNLGHYGHPVLVYDLPGHGFSDEYVQGKTTMQRHSLELYYLLRENNIQEAILMGHSYGGMIALDHTISYPRRVKGLVLLSTLDVDPRIMSPGLKAPIKEFIEKSRRFSDESLRGKSFNYDLAKGLTDDEIGEIGLRYTNHISLKNNFQAATSFDLRGKTSKIKVPTLIIRGGKDRLMNRGQTRRMHRRINGSKLLTSKDFPELEDQGHYFPIQNARILWEVISRNIEYLTGTSV